MTTSTNATASSYLGAASSFVSSMFATSPSSIDTLHPSTNFSQSQPPASWSTTALWTAGAVTALVGSAIAYRAYTQSGNIASAESGAQGGDMPNKLRTWAEVPQGEQRAYLDERATYTTAHHDFWNKAQAIRDKSIAELHRKSAPRLDAARAKGEKDTEKAIETFIDSCLENAEKAFEESVSEARKILAAKDAALLKKYRIAE